MLHACEVYCKFLQIFHVLLTRIGFLTERNIFPTETIPSAFKILTNFHLIPVMRKSPALHFACLAK